MYVLVAEDNEHCRRLVVAVLKAMGVRVIHEVASAKEALQALGERPYDALITDQNMPGCSGLDLILAVRRSSNLRLRRMPAMLLTGEATRDLVISAKMAGVDQFCVKPLVPQAFARKVSALLMKRMDGDREFNRLMAELTVRSAA